MDSGELLDLLGNENRRRILRLLSRKPCYVTEMSDYLGVSPKAVIDHLRRLEDAGLVESRTDDRRRKYFHISRSLRLEVSVTPYAVGMKSAYPASANLDIGQCSHLTVNVEPGTDDGVQSLASDLRRLRELERELSLAQRWVQGRIADAREDLADRVEGADETGLAPEVLTALADGAHTADELAGRLDVPVDAVESALDVLREAGVIEPSADGYRLA